MNGWYDDEEKPGFWQQVTPPILYVWARLLGMRLRYWWQHRRDRVRVVQGDPPPYHPNCRCTVVPDAWAVLARAEALEEQELRACAEALARKVDSDMEELAARRHDEEPS